MLNSTTKQNYTNTTKKTTEDVLSTIKKDIRKCKSQNMTVDISMLNLFDASKIVSMASTYHFLKFTQGSINWIVKSKEVEKMLKPLNLGNSKFTFA